MTSTVQSIIFRKQCLTIIVMATYVKCSRTQLNNNTIKENITGHNFMILSQA